MPYYTYITTNPNRTTLYIGMTGNLRNRLQHHYKNRGQPEPFAGRYYCYKLMYYEAFKTALEAIKRAKKVGRIKKENLINRVHPEWKFLNYIDDFRGRRN